MEEVKIPVCRISSLSVKELSDHLENRDSRLLAVESSLKEIQDSVRIWKNIIQDGLADLSVQLMVAKQKFPSMHRMHLEDVTEKHNRICVRLCNIEQRVEVMKTQEDSALDARMCKAERCLEEQQKGIVNLVSGLEQVCGRLDKLSKAHEIIGEQFLEPQCVQRMQSVPARFLTKASSSTPQRIQSGAKTTIYDAAAVPQNSFPSSIKKLSPTAPAHLDVLQSPQTCLPPPLQLQAQPQARIHGARVLLQRPYSDGWQCCSASIAQIGSDEENSGRFCSRRTHVQSRLVFDGRQCCSASISQNGPIPPLVVSDQAGILHHSMDDSTIPHKRATVNHQVAALVSPLLQCRSLPRL